MRSGPANSVENSVLERARIAAGEEPSEVLWILVCCLALLLSFVFQEIP